MATYKEIRGTQIEAVATDPSNPVEGQVWYNTTSNALKGFKIVIYANHMMRSSYPSMLKSSLNILKNKRSSKIEKKISSIKEMIELI